MTVWRGHPGMYTKGSIPTLPIYLNTYTIAQMIKHALLSILLFAVPAFAQDVEAPPLVPQDQLEPDVIRLGVSPFTPCVIEQKDGKFSGFDIELWDAIAKRLDIKTEYRKIEFNKLLTEVQESRIDAAIAGITITADRESIVDFSHPYLDSGLRIVVNSEEGGAFSLLGSPVALKIAKLLGLFALFVVIVSHIIWFFERGVEALNDKYFPGIFEALWFVCVTCTTVGYGDFSPKKWVSRIFTVFIMFTGIGFASIVISEVTAAATAANLTSDITCDDLSGQLVATQKNTISEAYLKDLGATVISFDDIEVAYAQIATGELSIAVFDSPNVMYHVNTPGKGKGKIKTSGELFYPHYLGIAVKQDSPLRDRINRALLKLKEDGTYDRLYQKWFGH